MKQLFKKLEEYLSAEYMPGEIEAQIRDAKIRMVKSDYVEVVWSSGILERLTMDGKGKLISNSDKIEKAQY